MARFDKNSFDTYMSAYIGSLNEDSLEEIFKKHDKDGNGYIEASELDGFIADIFSKELSKEELKEFKKQLLERIDNNNDGKLDKEELRSILPTEGNFLMQFCKVGKSVCGVDFVKIWNHYDKNKNGVLDGSELDGFLKDLILKTRPQTRHDCNLKRSIEIIKKSLYDKKTNKSTEGLDKAELFDLLQVEASCASFEGKSGPEFDKLFSEYDKDNSGAIEGDELVKLLSDLYLDSDESAVDDIKDVVLLKLDKNKDNKVQKSELKEFLKIKE
ncbi:secretagogin [Exaiptasia diaphana]|uniref:EF-hand domain-containing protein n=1 Tax=Exaiptasia diaphana TaxID=2652724 RepID=A0A913XKH3_EXADI|nr:secretagogin [Exaiptasia diaphana]KXJ11314.1 Calbindin-32 [Exaiptasia diaphana]